MIESRRPACCVPPDHPHPRCCAPSTSPALAGEVSALPLMRERFTHTPSRRRANAAPCARAYSFASATSRRIGAMPQLVHGNKLLGRHMLCRVLDHRGDLVRRLHRVRRHVDRADQHVLAGQQPQQPQRHVRIAAFQRHLVDLAGGQHREGRLVLPPLGAEAGLPVDVRLDAVAVTDMHRGLARQPLRRAFQRRDAPGRDLVHVNVEGGLIELDHVHAVGGQSARLLVQRRGERHRQRGLVAVLRVRDRIDDGHRPGQGEFQPPLGVRPRQPSLRRMRPATQRDRSGDGRHHRLVPVGADAHLHLAVEIDARPGTPGTRARNAGAIARHRKRCRCRRPAAASATAAWRRAWRRPTPRPVAATPATGGSVRPASPASAGCPRSWSPAWFPPSLLL